MPKKGSRIASSQAKARASARRKAHHVGPVLPSAAYQAPTEPEQEAPQMDAELDQSAASAPRTHTPAPAVRRSAPSARREHAAAAAVASSNVRNELLKIAAVTAIIAVALVVLKLGTTIGA
ncbi:MAG: hypothetical protein VW450_06990 [Chloroflexota bacterium]